MEKVGAFVVPAKVGASAVPQPVMVGRTRRVAGVDDPVRQRVHDEHLFGVLLAGEGTYQIGPDLLPLGEPLAWFQPAGEPERLKLQGSIVGWWIGFYWPGLRIKARGDELVLRSHSLTHTIPRWKRLDPEVIPQMVEIFQALLASAGAMDLTGHLRTRGLLLQLLGLYLEQPQEVDPPTNHWALEKFKRLLEARACENVSIEELAEEVQMSADHLRTLFQQRFGRNPLEFRIALRLAMAKELLCSSNLYIKEVAHRVGYPDPLYFSRAFKAQFGVSPREVIRRSRHLVD